MSRVNALACSVSSLDGRVIERGRREALEDEVWLGGDVATVRERHKRAADERIELVVAQAEIRLLRVPCCHADLLEIREKLLLEDLPHCVDREMRVDRVWPFA